MWIEKQRNISELDEALPAIHGLFYFDGKQLDDDFDVHRGNGNPLQAYEAKAPYIAFESKQLPPDSSIFTGSELQIQNGVWHVHIGEQVWVELFQSRSDAYRDFMKLAKSGELLVDKLGPDKLVIRYKDLCEWVLTYDTELNRLADVHFDIFLRHNEIPESMDLIPIEEADLETERTDFSLLPSRWKYEIKTFAINHIQDWKKRVKIYHESVHAHLIGYKVRINAKHRLFEAIPVFHTDNGIFANKTDKEDGSITTTAVSRSDKDFVPFDVDDFLPESDQEA